MILKIDHVGIAVRSLEERLPFWSRSLGIDVAGIETVSSERVKVAFLEVGSSRIELLEPTAPDSPIARHLERRGEGIHHLTLAVDDLDRQLGRLRDAGLAILGDGARPGAEGSRVAFLHPKSAGGLLLELVERGAGGASGSAEEEPLAPGATVLLYLREPQEKIWGVLRRLDPAGVVVEGIDLASFDDWVAQIERGEESVVGPSTLFVPMGRLEKILEDRRSGQLPSLAERFERRTGRTVRQVLDDPS